MSWIDISIILIFGYNIVVGLSKGFLKSLFGIGAFIIAITFAPVFQGPATNLLKNYLTGDMELTKLLGLGFSWFFLYILLNIIASFIIKGMEETPFKVVDRIAGLLVGLFMSIIIVLIPVLIIKALPFIKDIPQVKTSLSRSALLPLFEPIALPFQRMASNALREQREELMQKLKGNKPGGNKNSAPGKEQEIKNIMKEYNIDPLGSPSPKPRAK